MVVEQNCRQQLLPNLHPMIKVCVTNFSLNNLKIVGSSTYFILKKKKDELNVSMFIKNQLLRKNRAALPVEIDPNLMQKKKKFQHSKPSKIRTLL